MRNQLETAVSAQASRAFSSARSTHINLKILRNIEGMSTYLLPTTATNTVVTNIGVAWAKILGGGSVGNT